MKEKDFQREFGVWLKQNEPPTTVFELKICKQASIRFDAVKPHQIEALAQAKHGTLYHKIADSPVSWGAATPMRYTAPKPFDCFVMHKVQAFIVIYPYEPGTRHGSRDMIWIDVDRWMELEQRSDKKSIKITQLKLEGQVWQF